MVNANLKEEEESFLFPEPHYHLSLHDIKQQLQRQLARLNNKGRDEKTELCKDRVKVTNVQSDSSLKLPSSELSY